MRSDDGYIRWIKDDFERKFRHFCGFNKIQVYRTEFNWMILWYCFSFYHFSSTLSAKLFHTFIHVQFNANFGPAFLLWRCAWFGFFSTRISIQLKLKISYGFVVNHIDTAALVGFIKSRQIMQNLMYSVEHCLKLKNSWMKSYTFCAIFFFPLEISSMNGRCDWLCLIVQRRIEWKNTCGEWPSVINEMRKIAENIKRKNGSFLLEDCDSEKKVQAFNPSQTFFLLHSSFLFLFNNEHFRLVSTATQF